MEIFEDHSIDGRIVPSSIAFTNFFNNIVRTNAETGFGGLLRLLPGLPSNACTKQFEN